MYNDISIIIISYRIFHCPKKFFVLCIVIPFPHPTPEKHKFFIVTIVAFTECHKFGIIQYRVGQQQVYSCSYTVQ